MTFCTNHLQLFNKLAGTVTDKLGKDQSRLIRYSINKQGFRSVFDYDSIPDIAFFGCSVVLGVGVPENKRFSAYFKNSYNYGLATKYSNQDIYKIVKAFIGSDNYSPETIIMIVWCDKDDRCTNYLKDLQSSNIIHFKVGKDIDGCCKLLPECDADVSDTHPGPASHFRWAKTLSVYANRARRQLNTDAKENTNGTVSIQS